MRLCLCRAGKEVRCGVEAEPPEPPSQLWKPPLWHKDWQGNDVKVASAASSAAVLVQTA